MWPRPGSSKLVTTWIAVTLIASIVAALDGGWLANTAALAPARIWRGEIWRLISWIFVETGPMALALTCVILYKFGGELAATWGDRRLRRFALQIVVVAAVATTVLAAVSGARVWRCGGWAITDALVIAWARQFPARTLVLYGLISLRGSSVVAALLGIAILVAIFIGPIHAAPELVACGGAALYPRSLLRR